MLTQALSRDDTHQWQEAWDTELAQLERLRTWKIVPRPSNKPIILFSHVFKVKLGPNGEILKYKVRLIAGGHRQVKGLNYNETFVAAAKITLIRVILANAAQLDWEIDQIDIIGAYLNAEIDEDVFMEAPPGVLGANDRGKVCKLLKG